MAPRDPARGARIRDLREDKGRTQVAVAESLGVTRKAYQLWEEGANINWPNAQALAAYYGESVDYILDGIRNENGEDPIALLERRIGKLEATVWSLAALPDALRELQSGLDDHHGWVAGQFQELALTLQELRTGAGVLPPPAESVPPPGTSRATGHQPGSGPAPSRDA